MCVFRYVFHIQFVIILHKQRKKELREILELSSPKCKYTVSNMMIHNFSTLKLKKKTNTDLFDHYDVIVTI